MNSFKSIEAMCLLDSKTDQKLMTPSEWAEIKIGSDGCVSIAQTGDGEPK